MAEHTCIHVRVSSDDPVDLWVNLTRIDGRVQGSTLVPRYAFFAAEVEGSSIGQVPVPVLYEIKLGPSLEAEV